MKRKKKIAPKKSSKSAKPRKPAVKAQSLRDQIDELQETLRAIRIGRSRRRAGLRPKGDQVFTFKAPSIPIA